MIRKRIEKVAVLGSGVMGSRIACHLAGAGFQVLLLDISPQELNDKETAAGATLEDKRVRNRIVNDALQFALKSNPSPIYSKRFASRITTGNFDDDLAAIADSDWIIEAIIENPQIKQSLYEKVEQYRKEGSPVTTNTSGIPISILTEGRSEDFKKCFFGTHFFNPPRYLRLLEIIPGKDTDPQLLEFFEDFGSRLLGKTVVNCKDTPGFIANRIGVYSIQALFHLVEEMEMTVEEVDALTGPLIGRPKSATFRTCDVVGIDTLVKVAQGLEENCPDDEMRDVFKLPGYVTGMVDKGLLGAKSKQGFFKKIKSDEGKSEILTLDLKTLEYRAKEKVRFDVVGQARPMEDLADRLRLLLADKGKVGEFYRKSFFGIFAYVSNRIPEISDECYRIDDAVCAGFGWEKGPFAMWEMLGVKKTCELMKEAGVKYGTWVDEMIESGQEAFFRVEGGVEQYYDQNTKDFVTIPGRDALLHWDVLAHDKTIWKNAESQITDLGDGILNFSWSTKMNIIGGDVVAGLHKAIDLAEEEYDGLVISNPGEHFSAGANVGLIFMMAAEQEYDELDFAIRAFQNAVMRVRYSSIPVVVAPHGLTLGGGCEMAMHADKVIAHAESYIGLVEFGAGVIPGGGGTKEFALRTSDDFGEGDMRINTLRNRFLTIGQAKVATSAHEAFEHGFLRPGQDEVVISRAHQLTYAKQACKAMADKGYTKPIERTDIKVLGKEGMGIVYVGANTMESGNYISEHDSLISRKLGYVLCGGELSAPQEVSETYLLDLERKAFLELCTERKTLERLQSIATTGKVLRN